MDTVHDRPGVLIASPTAVATMEENKLKDQQEVEELLREEYRHSSIASHVMTVFQENKDARISSGIEEKLFQSLRAYNGHYDPEDIQRIKESGGSDIYMNVTPTKCRALMSWLRDIYQAAKEKSFAFEPTPVPDLPADIKKKLEDEIQRIVQDSQPQQQLQQSGAVNAATGVSEQNKMQADIEEALRDEIYQLAFKEVKVYEEQVHDQLVEGEWDKALSDFIEDFCVFQVAIMKGPVITKRPRLTWKNGRPVKVREITFLNKRVSPLDIYPSPSATNITDGDLVEHLRMSRKEIYDLIGVEGYKEENIRKILERYDTNSIHNWFDSYIEDDKVIEEYRGDTFRANKDVIHGLHFFGSVPYHCLEEWGYDESEIGTDTEKEFEVEAILAGDEVIKCVVNDDPLLRRPYYKASFQQIPGAWWGRSLPELMRDIQRMCNATARALSNNMGVASGPQIELYIDRLAADEEIDSIHPLKIWQLTSDPTGAGGRAVQFWQPSSNAGELLKVYETFELKADDATGIPRYAYGNERTGGAAQTASGLSMMLESANKGIKDAAGNIDRGLIKPRIEYQFYWNLLKNPELKFTGDIKVVPKGSQALTIKGSQELRRNEFLNILQNPVYQNIVGIEGVAQILREMAKSLGLGDNIIPSKLELKARQAKEQAMMQQQQQMQAQVEQQKQATGVQQVQMQVQQAEAASQRSAALKDKEMQLKAQDKEKDRQVKVFELSQRERIANSKSVSDMQKQQMIEDGKSQSDNKNIALSIQSGYQDENNKQ